MRNWIFRNEFNDLKEKLDNVRKEIKDSEFNIFSISSAIAHRENYHSDIIGLLLDPLGLHESGDIYFKLFLNFLIDSYNANIDRNNYSNVEIRLESPTYSMDLKGRIDILVRDVKSKHCIIIENKINNAGDMRYQLEKYYLNETKSGYAVDAIIYLPLNEEKKAPLTGKDAIDELIINIPAFSNKSSDLYTGWIIPCYKANANKSADSFIYEYSKLLKHLSKMGLYRNIEDEFYDIISEKDGLNRVQSIIELANGLNEYRADIFMEKLNENYAPFKKCAKYRKNYWLFWDYSDCDIEYKLDVEFVDNGAKLDIWNPHKWFELKEDDANDKKEAVRDIVRNKLKKINLFDDFKEYGYGNGMYRVFKLEEGHGIKDLDNEVLVYIQTLLKKLKAE